MVSSSLIESEIRRLSGMRGARLHFPRALEAHFEQQTVNERCQRLWLEGTFALVLYACFAICDERLNPSGAELAFWLRAGLVLPLALSVNMAMWLRPSLLVREAAILLVVSTAAFVEVYLARRSGSELSAVMAVLAVLLFANAVMRLSFLPSALLAAVLLAGEASMLFSNISVSLSNPARALVLSSAIAMLTLIANYSSHREERLRFLQLLQNEHLRSRLESANSLLALSARTDGLTKIEN